MYYLKCVLWKLQLFDMVVCENMLKNMHKRWLQVSIIIDPVKWNSIQDLKNTHFDVIIEFSVPTAAIENMNFYAENNAKVVMATTWWYDKVEDIKPIFRNTQVVHYLE